MANGDPNKKKTVDEFALSIKEKYPQYKDVDNLTLAKKMVEKYPIYADKVDLGSQGVEPVGKQQTSASGVSPSPSVSGDSSSGLQEPEKRLRVNEEGKIIPYAKAYLSPEEAKTAPLDTVERSLKNYQQFYGADLYAPGSNRYAQYQNMVSTYRDRVRKEGEPNKKAALFQQEAFTEILKEDLNKNIITKDDFISYQADPEAYYEDMANMNPDIFRMKIIDPVAFKFEKEKLQREKVLDITERVKQKFIDTIPEEERTPERLRALEEELWQEGDIRLDLTGDKIIGEKKSMLSEVPLGFLKGGTSQMLALLSAGADLIGAEETARYLDEERKKEVERLIKYMTQIEGDILDNLSQGNLNNAARLSLQMTGESLLLMLGTRGLVGGISKPLLRNAVSYGTFSAVSAIDHYQDIKNEKWFNDMSDIGKLGYLAAYGGAEGIGEMIGSRVAVKAFKGLSTGDKIAKQSVSDFFKEYGKALGVAFSEEGLAEGVTGVSQYIADTVAQGGSINIRDAWDAFSRSAVAGMGMAGVTTTAGKGLKGSILALNSIPVKKADKELKDILNAAQQTDNIKEKDILAARAKELSEIKSQLTKQEGERLNRFSEEDLRTYAEKTRELNEVSSDLKEVEEGSEAEKILKEKAQRILGEISELNDKYKEDAVQERKTEEVPVGEEAEVGEEMVGEVREQAEEVRGEEEVRQFAERIARGEDVTSLEDQQFYENNKEEVESALQQIQGEDAVLSAIDSNEALNKIDNKEPLNIEEANKAQEELLALIDNLDPARDAELIELIEDEFQRIEDYDNKTETVTETTTERRPVGPPKRVAKIKERKASETVGGLLENSQIETGSETEGEVSVLELDDDGNIVISRYSTSKRKEDVDRLETGKKPDEVEFVETILDDSGNVIGVRLRIENPKGQPDSPIEFNVVKRNEEDERPLDIAIASRLKEVGDVAEVEFEQAYETVTKTKTKEVPITKIEKKDEKGKSGNRLFNKPLQEVKDIADKYFQRVFKGKRQEYKPEQGKILNKEKAKRIARAFEEMKHNPNDPDVKAAYEAMAKETMDQYQALKQAGYRIEINNDEPYNSSAEMIDDVRKNKRMKILSTESEFGDTPITDKQRQENPLLKKSGEVDINGVPLLINDVFRAVHDFFGHSEYGNSFGPKGEEVAWNVHARMFSPLARRAMTTETRGQNSWVNFSGVNEKAFELRDKARALREQGKEQEAQNIVEEIYKMMRFADQKIGLLPEEFSQIEEVTEDVTAATEGKPSLGNIMAKVRGEQRADDSIKKQVRKDVDNAISALKEVAPEVKIQVYETTEDFIAAGNGKDSRGEYNPESKTIHINLETANGRTVGHEVFHALLLHKGLTNAQAKELTGKMMKSVRRVASPELLARLDDFSSKYDNGLQSEESLAELVGIMMDEFSELDTPAQNIIIKWLNDLAKLLGLKGFDDTDTIEMLNTLVVKLGSGDLITNEDVAIMMAYDTAGSKIIPDPPLSESRKQLKEGTKMVVSGNEPLNESEVEFPTKINLDGDNVIALEGAYFEEYLDGTPIKSVADKRVGMAISLAEGKNAAKINTPFQDKDVARRLKSLQTRIKNAKGNAKKPLYEKLQKETAEYLRKYRDNVKDTILGLYDTLYEDFVKESKQWYEGANRFANFLANKYGLSLRQTAGIIGTLSPQKDWFTNVSIAERVIDTMSLHADDAITQEVVDVAYDWMNRRQKKGKINSAAKALSDISPRIVGKSINQMMSEGFNNEAVAIAVRAIDHYQNSPAILSTYPTGQNMDYSGSNVSWNSYPEIGRAISIFMDGSDENISRRLGKGNKVRSFVNNIAAPSSKNGHITVDTHAMSVAFMLPISAKNASSLKLFGGGDSVIYSLIEDAYRQAAASRGVLPREMQSVTWEAQRVGINNSKRKAKDKKAVFKESERLESEGVSAYDRAVELSQSVPFNTPEWARRRGLENIQKPGRRQQKGASDYQQFVNEARAAGYTDNQIKEYLETNEGLTKTEIDSILNTEKKKRNTRVKDVSKKARTANNRLKKGRFYNRSLDVANFLASLTNIGKIKDSVLLEDIESELNALLQRGVADVNQKRINALTQRVLNADRSEDTRTAKAKAKSFISSLKNKEQPKNLAGVISYKVTAEKARNELENALILNEITESEYDELIKELDSLEEGVNSITPETADSYVALSQAKGNITRTSNRIKDALDKGIISQKKADELFDGLDKAKERYDTEVKKFISENNEKIKEYFTKKRASELQEDFNLSNPQFILIDKLFDVFRRGDVYVDDIVLSDKLTKLISALENGYFPLKDIYEAYRYILSERNAEDVVKVVENATKRFKGLSTEEIVRNFSATVLGFRSSQLGKLAKKSKTLERTVYAPLIQAIEQSEKASLEILKEFDNSTKKYSSSFKFLSFNSKSKRNKNIILAGVYMNQLNNYIRRGEGETTGIYINSKDNSKVDVGSIDWLGIILGKEKAIDALQGDLNETTRKSLLDGELRKNYATKGKDLKYMEQVWKELPKNDNGSVNWEEFFENSDKYLDKETQNFILAANKAFADSYEYLKAAKMMRGEPIDNVSAYYKRARLDVGNADIDYKTINLTPNMRVVAGSSIDRVTDAVGAIDFNVINTVSANAVEAPKFFNFEINGGLVNSTLGKAMQRSTVKAAMQAIKTDAKQSIDYTYNTPGDVVSTLASRIVGGQYVEALFRVKRLFIEFTSMFFRMYFQTGTVKSFSSLGKTKTIGKLEDISGIRITPIQSAQIEQGKMSSLRKKSRKSSTALRNKGVTDYIGMAMGVAEITLRGGFIYPHFLKNFNMLTNEVFDPSKLSDPQYLEEYRQVITDAMAITKIEMGRIYPTGNKFAERRNVKLLPFTKSNVVYVRADSAFGRIMSYMSNYVFKESEALSEAAVFTYNEFSEKGFTKKGFKGAATQVFTSRESGVAIGVLVGGFIYSYLSSLNYLLSKLWDDDSDDEEKREASELLKEQYGLHFDVTSGDFKKYDMEEDMKGSVSFMINQMPFFFVGRYGQGFRILSILGMSGIYQTTKNKATKEITEEFLRNNFYTAPVNFNEFGMRSFAAKNIPVVNMAVNTTVGLAEATMDAADIARKIEKGKDITEDEKNYFKAFNIMFKYTNAALLVSKGVQIPETRQINKLIEEEITEKKGGSLNLKDLKPSLPEMPSIF